MKNSKNISEKLKSTARFIPCLLLLAFLIVIYFILFVPNDETVSIEGNNLILLCSMLLMVGFSFTAAIVRNNIFKKISGIFFFVASPVAVFFLTEFYYHNPVSGSPIMKTNIMILNIAVYLALNIVLLLVTTNSAAAVMTVATVFGIFGFINYLAVEYRGVPVYPWDIMSAGTAVSVLDNYDFEPTIGLMFIIFSFVFIISVSPLVYFRVKCKKIWLQLVLIAVAVSSSIGYFAYLRTDSAQNKFGYYPYLYSELYLYKYNGTAVTMIWSSRYLSVEKPENYSLEELDELYNEYKNEENEKNTEVSVTEENPNIIVIMNEAFSDLSCLGLNLKTTTDYMPFIHSLSEDSSAKVGQTRVSVLGGNTPNSEFEFLTGMSMAFLPAGSIPYQQFIKDEIPTIITQTESLGYKTMAIHPYYSSGWKRKTVYPLLGFDSIFFSSDLSIKNKIRTYISDESMYEKILDSVEATDEPLFAFGVTMQNHGGYTTDYENFTSDVKLENLSSKALEQYLSLIKVSDSAFEYLVEYIDEFVDEPTVVLMFGDHQPSNTVVSSLYKISGKSDELTSDDVETQQKRYITPYIIWSNYDLDVSGFADDISLNYLSGELVRTIGLETTPFQNWQNEIMKEYPILNAGSFYKTSEDGFISTEFYGDEDTLNLYSRIQYNYLFGKKNRLTSLFTVN